MANGKEGKPKRAYNRKPTVEITVDNYVDFTPKQLWERIDKLQNQKSEDKELKKEIARLKAIIKSIAGIADKA